MGEISAEYFYKAQNGDKSAFDLIYNFYIKIVYDCLSKSKGFFLRSVDENDYISAGFYAFYKAIMSFEPEKGYTFSTYAYPVITNELKTVNIRNSTIQKKFESNIESLDSPKTITDGDGVIKDIDFINEIIDDEFKDSDAKLNIDILVDKIQELLTPRSFDMFKMLSMGYTHEMIGKKYGITGVAVDKQLVQDRKYLKKIISKSNKARLRPREENPYYYDMYEYLYNGKEKPLTEEELKEQEEIKILKKLNKIFSGVFNFDVLYNKRVLDLTADEILEKMGVQVCWDYIYKKSQKSRRAVYNFIKIANEIYNQAESGVTFEELSKKYNISEDEVIFFYDLKNYLDGEDFPIVDGRPIFEKYSKYLSSNWAIIKKIEEGMTL